MHDLPGAAPHPPQHLVPVSRVNVDLYSVYHREHAPNALYRLSYVGADLRLISPQQDTSPHCETADILASVSRDACLLPAFAGYSLYLPTEGWLRLSRPGCLVLRRGGLPVLRRSPIQALTGPGVDRHERVTAKRNRQVRQSRCSNTACR